MPPGAGNSCTFVDRVVRALGPTANHVNIIIPRNILFHTSDRNGVHRRLVRRGLLSAIVNLPRGLFFNANVPTTVLLFGGGGASSAMLFVSTDGRFGSNGGRGRLVSDGVTGIVRACGTQRDISGCTCLTDFSRVGRGSFGLGVPHCISAFRRRTRVSLSAIHSRHLRLGTRLRDLRARVTKFLGRLNCNTW